MMKFALKKIAMKALSVIPALAMLIAVSSASATCFITAYQPDVPQGLEKFMK